MKITVALLLLAAVSNATNSGSKSREKIEEKPGKRGIVEGNAGVEKRAPVLPTVAPAGVEYAETKQNLPDKSPSQQSYATPVPQISKISDFLNGQGPAFQDAITSHLYSPFSVYNPRFEVPTTYEVSPPVSSQLAYTEHRMSMPSPNSLQYISKPQKLGKPINYPQPQVVTQQSYEQQNLGYEPLLHQIPNNGIHNFRAIQYNQAPQGYIEQQQLQYIQDPSNQLIPTNIQQHKNQHLEQRDLKSQPTSAQVLGKQNVQQVPNDKPQTALSFAKFIYNPPLETPAYDQYKNQQLQTQSQHSQPQPQTQLQSHLQIQPQYQTQQVIQSQPQQYQAQSQPLAQIQYELQHPTQLPQLSYHAPQELQYQTSQQIQYQPQPQIQYQEEQPQFYQIQSQFLQPQALPQNHIQAPQYQIQAQNYQLQQQPQYFEKSEPIAKQPVSEKQYFKQSSIQPQLNQQIFPQQQINPAYKQPAAIPTFPPVQYFGKFAQSIFANSQH